MNCTASSANNALVVKSSNSQTADLSSAQLPSASLHHPCEPSVTMKHYPEVNAQERSEASSRHDSASSVDKGRPQQSSNTSTHEKDTQYTSFPPLSNTSHHRQSTDSTSSNGDIQSIQAKYARYTDAPPQYTEQQYQGKTEDEQNHMRMSDYSKEISRIMSRQLMKDMQIAQHKADVASK